MWWFDKHVFLKNKITIQNVHFKKWINVTLIDDITSVIILIICHWSVNNSLFLKYLLKLALMAYSLAEILLVILSEVKIMKQTKSNTKCILEKKIQQSNWSKWDWMLNALNENA